jgi:ectoine hydroxylase-related dioxygenase (phytanoyl-CoA dioxygenase family)
VRADSEAHRRRVTLVVQDHAAGWWMYGQSLHISIMVNIDQATKENGASARLPHAWSVVQLLANLWTTSSCPVLVSSGCLEVVAGEHNKGLLGPEFQAVPQELVDKYTWVPLETNPGDIVFFDSYVPHRSGTMTLFPPLLLLLLLLLRRDRLLVMRWLIVVVVVVTVTSAQPQR